MKHYFFAAAIAMTFALGSCKMGGMQSTESGIQYEVFESKLKNDTAIKEGDVITMDSRFTLKGKAGKDSLLSDTRKTGQPQRIMLDKRMRTQDMVDKALYDVVILLRKGDSASFLVPVDSLDARTLASVPFLKKGDNIKVDIHITGVMDSVAFQQEMKDMKVKQNAQFEEQKPQMKEQSEQFFKMVKGQHKEQWAKDSVIIKDYIKKNKLNAIALPSGLHYVITEKGTGSPVQMFDSVSVNYKGYLTNGEVFDESKGQPFSFMVGVHQVIAGWDQGLPLFNQGGKGKLIIPSYMAYGEKGMGGIPANSVLVFDIEVVGTK